MKALVYHGPGQLSIDEKPKPVIEKATDAVIKILKTTICGTDLHILKGDVVTVKPGRILGHEGVGLVESVGEEVSNFKKGDKVLISCITSCGKCSFCRNQMYSHCQFGGWILGNTIDGTQAEYVRIPFADTSLYHIPSGISDEVLVMFSDVLPTGYETGALRGQIKLGDVVAIIGAGPIGLSALLTVQFFGPSEIIMIDPDENRLKVAKRLGATSILKEKNEEASKVVLQLTHNKGVDVAIEAVGTPEAFDTCQSILAPGGRIANVGVHGKSVNLHLENLWHQNITLTTALVDTYSIPTLLKIFLSGKLEVDPLITHHFNLPDILKAYEVFKDATHQHTLKVILENQP